MHLRNATYSESKQMFFKKIDQVIFAEHEIRSLQSLLHEYRQIAREYGLDLGKLKSSYVKEVLINEYGDDIGFQERPEKNKSEFVYDTKGGGNYIEAAFNPFGITDEQLILNLVPFKHIKEVPPLNWCPTGTECVISVETTFRNEKETWTKENYWRKIIIYSAF